MLTVRVQIHYLLAEYFCNAKVTKLHHTTASEEDVLQNNQGTTAGLITSCHKTQAASACTLICKHMKLTSVFVCSNALSPNSSSQDYTSHPTSQHKSEFETCKYKPCADRYQTLHLGLDVSVEDFAVVNMLDSQRDLHKVIQHLQHTQHKPDMVIPGYCMATGINTRHCTHPWVINMSRAWLKHCTTWLQTTWAYTNTNNVTC